MILIGTLGSTSSDSYIKSIAVLYCPFGKLMNYLFKNSKSWVHLDEKNRRDFEK